MINKHVSTELRCYIHLFHRYSKPMDTVSIKIGALKREISRLTGKHLYIFKTFRHWARLYLPFSALWEALPLLRFVCAKRLFKWCTSVFAPCLTPLLLKRLISEVTRHSKSLHSDVTFQNARSFLSIAIFGLQIHYPLSLLRRKFYQSNAATEQ